LGADLRFDLGYASLIPFHTGRKLVFVNHAFCQTIDQAFHPVPQFLELRLQTIGILSWHVALVGILIFLIQDSGILQDLGCVRPYISLQRRSAVCLRSFFRYLLAEGMVARDLSQVVSGPVLYQFDDIPRAFTKEQVEGMLRIARSDRSPVGLRDHAILLLLATYGLRAGEVVRLRLDDIDWREDRIRVRRSKTGVESHLPLVGPVGEALLKYLQKGRPETDAREVFISIRAPYRPFRNGSALYAIVGRRLKQTGFDVRGRRGSHAFRFARAGSLLNAQVPLKAIGDLLGHRNATSTEIYLRLATDDLRAISLGLPRKENQCPPGRTKTKRS